MATAPPQQPASLVVPQVARVLPGPAGKLQQLAAAGALQQATPEALGLKDHCSTHSTRASRGHDICFQSHVWREATSFVEGSQQQLHTVKLAKDLSLGKVPKMLVVLGAVQPSGVNSAFCRVKDPTGSMGAAFHQSVLQHQQYQQGWLGPGTVVLLQQVSVFTPTPGTSYLAVTASNICKIWSDTSAYQRLRNPQPMQQQQQTQQTQQHAGKLHSQAPQQWPSGANSQLDSTSQLPSHSSRQPQHTSQPPPQQQHQQQTQGISGGQPLVQPQLGGSPSVAGSNRSSAFFPSSPDVTSLFRKPTQQPQAQQQQQQQKGDFQQQQQQQQQPHQHQQQPLQSQQEWQQSIQGQGGSCGLVTQRPPATVSQPQQQQQQQGRAQNQGSTGTGRGLMLPPAPRAPTSFRAQLHKQQHQQQTQSQAPNAGHQCQLQGQPLSQAAGRRTPNVGPQLLDDLLDDLVNLEDASDGDAINLNGATAAITATAPAKKLAANGYHRISSSMRASGFASTAPSQQQIQQSTDSQTPRTSSQSVPDALLQQGQLQHTSVGSSRAGSSNHAPASGVGAAGNDAAEAIDGVDDVVAAIFGSQMAPRPAAATTGGLVDHATPSAAVASIFGRQMAPPGHNNTHAGKPFSNTQQVQQTAGSVFSRSPAVDSSSNVAGNNIGRSTKDSLTGSGVGDIQRLPTQSDAKRLKVSPATGPPMPGPPLQPVSGRLNMQQQQQIQQPPVSQQASRQHKTQAGLQMTQHRGNLGGLKPSAATPLRPLLGLQGAGAAASLLDDLLGNDLEYLDEL